MNRKILYIVLLMLAIGLCLVISISYMNNKGDKYVIKVDGDVIYHGTLPVGDKVIERQVDHIGYNKIIINSKGVYVNESDCPDKICIKQSQAQTYPIVCLPHKLVIERK